jgi:hypothetical protein
VFKGLVLFIVLSSILLQNDSSWSKFAYEPLVELFVEYTALLSQVSRLMECKFKDKNDEILAGLQKKSEHVEKKYRKCSNVHESVFTQPDTRNHNGIIIKENYKHCTPQDGCAMIGVWNLHSRERFKGM